MIRKAGFLAGALALVWLAIPAAATGNCTVQCFDRTMSTVTESTAQGCVDYGYRFCANHGGLLAVQYGP
jgi:hypothetical protein